MMQKIMGRFKAWFGREDGAGEMVQLRKVLTAKPDNLSSVLGTHMVEGENLFL